MIPLDKNESYWLLDEELVEACKQSDAKELSTYPDYGELKRKIAEYARVSEDMILITAGSDSVIRRIAEGYAAGKKAILPVPTFYGYESILEAVGAQTIPISYHEENAQFLFPTKETISALQDNEVEALFLCQPNNPLGCSIPEEDITALVDNAAESETMLISDEAYFEFSNKTLLPYLQKQPNLIIVRTFSKGFGLSGARIGYAIASPEIIRELQKGLLPWPIAHYSVAVALALLSKTEHIKARLEIVMKEREVFADELRKLPGVTVYPSDTNFLLAKVPDARAAQSTLSSAGVRVALGESMSRYPEAKALLRNTLRMAIPAPQDASRVLAALRSSSQM